MNIHGATVLVTGANRGLGRALVLASLAAGAKRVYATARDVRQLESLARSMPDRVLPLSLDITDLGSIEAAAARATDINVLINNAGVLSSYNVLTSTPDELAQDFATNCFGMLATTRACLPALERTKPSSVVNVLSIVSLANLPALGGYSAAKAAAFSLTQALRSELASKGVRVHAVLPGPIDTDMVRAIEMEKTSPEVVATSILEGVKAGLEEILPDPASREMFAVWQTDPKALEVRLAAMGG